MKTQFSLSAITVLLILPMVALKAQQKFSISPEIGIGFSQTPSSSIRINPKTLSLTTKRNYAKANIVIGVSSDIKIYKKLHFTTGLQYQETEKLNQTVSISSPNSTDVNPYYARTTRVAFSKVGIPIFFTYVLGNKSSHVSLHFGLRKNYFLNGIYETTPEQTYNPLDKNEAPYTMSNRNRQLSIGASYQIKNRLTFSSILHKGGYSNFANTLPTCRPDGYHNTDFNIIARYLLIKM